MGRSSAIAASSTIRASNFTAVASKKSACQGGRTAVWLFVAEFCGLREPSRRASGRFMTTVLTYLLRGRPPCVRDMARSRFFFAPLFWTCHTGCDGRAPGAGVFFGWKKVLPATRRDGTWSAAFWQRPWRHLARRHRCRLCRQHFRLHRTRNCSSRRMLAGCRFISVCPIKAMQRTMCGVFLRQKRRCLTATATISASTMPARHGN